MAGLGTPEILIIAVVVMALFGARRLPDSARALGRSMRIFKAETKGLHEDETAGQPLQLSAPAAAAAPAAPTAAFDVHTGQPLEPAEPVPAAQPLFDPYTGKRLDAPQTDHQP